MMLDRKLLEILKDASQREDWLRASNAYLELEIATAEDSQDSLLTQALGVAIQLRDRERIALLVNQVLAESN